MCAILHVVPLGIVDLVLSIDDSGVRGKFTPLIACCFLNGIILTRHASQGVELPDGIIRSIWVDQGRGCDHVTGHGIDEFSADCRSS